jgi:hypothetical protein
MGERERRGKSATGLFQGAFSIIFLFSLLLEKTRQRIAGKFFALSMSQVFDVAYGHLEFLQLIHHQIFIVIIDVFLVVGRGSKFAVYFFNFSKNLLINSNNKKVQS